MTARIVPMTAAHIDGFMPFEHEMFGTEAWTARSYRDELADKRYRHYVVAEDEDGTLLGWAGVMVVADTAQIMTVGVVPAAQRQGIGQLLVDALLDEARRRGAESVILEVRVDNAAGAAPLPPQRLRRPAGRRGYYGHGRVDGLEMQRVLMTPDGPGR